ESAPIGMAVVSLDRRLLDVNRAFTRMLEGEKEALVGASLSQLIHPDDEDSDLEVRDQVLAGDQEWSTTEKRLITASGRTVWVQHSVGLMRDEDGRPAYYISQFVDITEELRAREDLERMATTDALTGLPNRAALIERANRWLEAGEPLCVMFCDLDGFKAVNDRHGHVIGDEVLAAVARRLSARVRDTDIIARFGGDEFVAAFPGVDSDAQASRVADHLLGAVRDPLQVGDTELWLGLSVGMARAHPGDSLDAVLARADAALYEAKSAGRWREH
ncbi:MAG: diguanylate cyclase, partial [Candidatus Nanopelagicales bacterium]